MLAQEKEEEDNIMQEEEEEEDNIMQEELSVEDNCFEKYSETKYLGHCKFYIEVIITTHVFFSYELVNNFSFRVSFLQVSACWE